MSPNSKTEPDTGVDELRSRIVELETQLKDKDLEVEALRQVGRAIGSLADVEDMLRQIADVIVQVTGADLCLIYLLNDTRTELVLRAASMPASGYIGHIRLRIGEGITGWVAKERQPVALDREAWRDERFKSVPICGLDNYHSMLSVPVPGKDDLVGVINLRTTPPHEYTPTQIALLNSIATQVGWAVDNLLQFRKLKKQASHVTTLSEISRTITSDMYLEEVLQLIVAMTADSMNFKICSVMLLDEDQDELIIKATQSKSKLYTKRPRIKLHESISGQAAIEGKPISVLDVRKTSDYRFPDIAKREGLCSLIALPLTVKGSVIGVLNCYTAKPRIFTEEEIGLLGALANHAAIAIENAKLMVRSAIIQEMHHRVKNSLQTIASLLRLQLRYGNFESVEQMLNESINRILAIASVHELLSSENLDNVSIKKVAEGILAGTAGSITPPDKDISLAVEGADLMLSARKATSVALILNELVQNAIEHGFKHTDHGTVTITIKDQGETVELCVADDGEELPSDFDLKQYRGLGLQIVENLVMDDLHGKFVLENDSGIIKSLVVFPK